MLYALERGLVSLDDRLGPLAGRRTQDKRDITLLHLLTHTSGMSASFLLSQEAEGDRDALGALLLPSAIGERGRQGARFRHGLYPAGLFAGAGVRHAAG